MGFKDFFDSAIKQSHSFFRGLVESHRKAITNTPEGLNELPYEVLFPSNSFCPDKYQINLQFRHYLSYSFAPHHAVCLEYMCFLATRDVNEMKSDPIDEIVEYLRRAYSDIKNRAVKFGSIDANFSSDQFSEMLESLITVNCYDILFCPSTEEETMDISTQDRIRSLFWVTQGYLDVNIKLELKTVDDLLNDAIIELLKLDSYRKMKDKFECLIRCAKNISEAIIESSNSYVSADEFIPVLIYVIIRANPTRIISNIKFMQRFSLEFRTVTGESAYRFTELCSTMDFIQKMNGDSVSLSDEVFRNFVIDYSPS